MHTRCSSGAMTSGNFCAIELRELLRRNPSIVPSLWYRIRYRSWKTPFSPRVRFLTSRLLWRRGAVRCKKARVSSQTLLFWFVSGSSEPSEVMISSSRSVRCILVNSFSAARAEKYGSAITALQTEDCSIYALTCKKLSISPVVGVLEINAPVSFFSW